MRERNRKRGVPRRAAALLLSLTLLLLCTGCTGGIKHPEEVPEEVSDSTLAEVGGGDISGGQPSSDNPQAGTNTGGTGNQGWNNQNQQPGGPPGPPPEFGNMVDMYNVVLVMDTSGSMNRSDPDRKAIQSACMFLDTLFISDEGGDQKDGIPSARVGLIWYNDGKPQTAYDTLARLDDVEAVETVKQHIYNIYPDAFPEGRGDSGLPDALAKALELLPKNQNPDPGGPQAGQMSSPAQGGQWGGAGGPGPGPGPGPDEKREKNMIVLLTDGYTNYDGMNLNGDMPCFDSSNQEKLENVMETAKSTQVEIFILGLNDEAMGDSWTQFQKLANYVQLEQGPPPNGNPGINQMQQTGNPGEPPPPPPLTGNVSGMFANPAAPGGTNSRGVNYCLCDTVVYAEEAFVQMTAALVLQGSGSLKMDGSPRRDNWWLYDMKIDEDGTSAAIFYILSDSRLEGMTLQHVGQDGRTTDYDLRKIERDERGNPTHWLRPTEGGEERKVRILWYKGFTTLSIMNPNPGTWYVGAQGNSRSFLARYILIGGIDLKLDAKQMEPGSNVGIITIKAIFNGAGMKQDYYEYIKDNCTCTAYLDNGPPPQEMGGNPAAGAQTVSMGTGGAPQDQGPPPRDDEQKVVLKPESGALTGTIQAKYPGRYRVEFQMQSKDVTYNMKDVFFEMTPGTPDALSFKRVSEKQDLTPKLIGWEGIPLRIVDNSFESGGMINASLNKDGRKVELKSANSGTGELSIIVEFDTEYETGQQWRLYYPFSVMDTSNVEARKPEFLGGGVPRNP